MTAVETLRKVAERLRGLAEAAPDGPWLLDLAGYRAPGWPRSRRGVMTLYGDLVWFAYELHCLAGDGHLSQLQVRDAALDILLDLATETP